MFDLRWEDTAVNELALIWVEGDSATRDLVTDAVHRMEYHLFFFLKE